MLDKFDSNTRLLPELKVSIGAGGHNKLSAVCQTGLHSDGLPCYHDVGDSIAMHVAFLVHFAVGKLLKVQFLVSKSYTRLRRAALRKQSYSSSPSSWVAPQLILPEEAWAQPRLARVST